MSPNRLRQSILLKNGWNLPEFEIKKTRPFNLEKYSLEQINEAYNFYCEKLDQFKNDDKMYENFLRQVKVMRKKKLMNTAQTI